MSSFEWFHTCTISQPVSFVKTYSCIQAEEEMAREGMEEQEQPDETEGTEKEEEEVAAEEEADDVEAAEHDAFAASPDAVKRDPLDPDASNSPPPIQSIYPGMKISCPHLLLNLGQQLISTEVTSGQTLNETARETQ